MFVYGRLGSAFLKLVMLDTPISLALDTQIELDYHGGLDIAKGSQTDLNQGPVIKTNIQLFLGWKLPMSNHLICCLLSSSLR